jgi:gliding motility-associated-like protein
MNERAMATLRTLLVLTAWLAAFGVARATHIIGGEMFYEHLGGNQYRVTLKLYRDCGPDNTNNTGFDLQAQIAAYRANGTLVDNAFVDQATTETVVPVVLNDPCLSAPPTVCVRTVTYIHVFTLPPVAGGYVVSYQRCCRTPAMVNLNGQQGLTCTVTIPGPPNAANSSAQFSELPAIALCMDQDMVFDQSGFDPDGDQLVYSICAPLQGASAGNPAPMADPPPYQPVTYAAGFSGANPINSTPPIAIDPVTGILTVHPTVLGTFTVGICIEEYRNGVLLNTARRDFMFRVVLCNANVQAVIAAQSPQQACQGLTQTFINQSVGATTWLWDFGDPTTTTDQSTVFSPVYTYPAPGTYPVTLIANPGAPCADTIVVDYLVAPAIQPVFAPAVGCGPSQLTLLAAGTFDPSATFTWDFGPTATPTTATGNPVTALFQPNGAQPVTVTATAFGCTGSFTANVQVYPQPVAAFGEQAEFCQSLTHQFQNLSTDATAYSWDFGDPGNPGDQSTQADPSYTYVLPGYHTIQLIARNGPVCADTVTRVFDVHVPPNAFFYRPPIRCPGQSAFLSALGAAGGGASITWDFGAGLPSDAVGSPVQVAFNAVGAYPVTLTMIEFGCTASYTDSVIVYPYPVADFINGSLACVGDAFPFASLSSAWTPFTLAWDLGDGTQRGDSAFWHTYAQAGTYGVSLTITTATGCVASVTANRPGAVVVHPSPTAAFTALPEEVSLLRPNVAVTDYSALAAEWLYVVEGERITAPDFEHVFSEPGQYIITQLVTTEHGCTDSTTRLVVVSDHLFHAPNAFTPDGDGKNDEWRPMVLGAREYELVIYDRWGIERFRTTETDKGWSGDGLPASVFVYTARIKEWGARAKDYVGHFSLLR